MSTLWGGVAAVAAGVSFAGAGVLQQRAAARTARPSLSLGLLIWLARQPVWLAGIGLAVLANLFQALALAGAPLALVQPLIVTELIFAIPLSARLYRRRLGRREWRGILTVALGLAATVWGASPRGTGGTGDVGRWLVVGGALTGAATVLAVAGLRLRGELRASLFAAGAALLFALYASLLAATVAGFVRVGIATLATATPYAMTAASLAGLLLIQSAFHAGPLAVTMPMVDWLQPLVAVLLGVSILDESVDTSTVHLAVLVGGAVLALVGILYLDASPRVRGMQRALTAATSRNPGSRTVDTTVSHVDAATAAWASRAARRGRATRGDDPLTASLSSQQNRKAV